MHFIYPIQSKVTRAALLLLSITLLSACSNQEEVPQPKAEADLIRWSVQSVDDGTNNSRALIDNYENLRGSCTANESRAAETIGLFGTYILNGATETVFNDRNLWWWAKENGNPYNDQLGNRSYWNYDDEDEEWVDNATYTFRAYYPKSQVTLEPGSGTSQLLSVYDTQKSQFDLMVAYKRLVSKGENPVTLPFKHALAALKFNFLFKDSDVTDQLEACWLENTQENGFYSSSTLNHGAEGNIGWPASTAQPVGEPIYYWQPAEPLTIHSTAVTAYSTTATEGALYTENDGWLLIIPQDCSTLQLCFKTSTGGDEVYRAKLPATTYEAGKRYTYQIRITATQIELLLTIADWNERKSSHEIDFNN